MKSRKHSFDIVPYLFIAPQLILFAVFFVLPAATGIIAAFSKWNIYTDPLPIFNGLDNFVQILVDSSTSYFQQFRTGMGNTLLFVVLCVPFCILIPLFMAILLSLKPVGHKFFQALFYLPNILSISTVVLVWFYVSFLGAFGISLPVVLYFVVQFVAPGLTREEKRLLRPGLFAAVILFCVGVAFAFSFMLPMGIAFMSSMSESMQMEMFPDAQSYYSMVMFLTLAVGVVFEVPLIEVILIYLGVLNVEWLKKNRRIVFMVILIFSQRLPCP